MFLFVPFNRLVVSIPHSFYAGETEAQGLSEFSKVSCLLESWEGTQIRPKQSDLTSVSWIVIDLQLRETKGNRILLTLQDHSRLKTLQVRLVYRKGEKEEWVTFFPLYPQKYLLPPLLHWEIELVSCGSIFPEFPGELLQSRTIGSLFLYYWQGFWIQLCKLFTAQECLVEE